ncbi:MAG: hypothetical protein HY548_09305 [Elusimicrobia bacterium]|nr:hypothetical protein [Elusimicrobiota bacterium]
MIPKESATMDGELTKEEAQKISQERAKEFKDWLAKRGWTYDYFAKHLGVNYTTVARWGQHAPLKLRGATRTVLEMRAPDCPLLK